MGEAWLARDAERGEEVVAKVVPADASPERIALLRREARLVRKLAHARIVPVYGFRSGDRGSAVTLRYMPGGDAGRKRGAPPLEVVRLGRDVAEALEYLHGLGVVHRDVKPSNVLLDEEGRALLADFGIAAVAWGDEDGIVLRGGGSRASLSPQQLAGEPAQPADDLYALGAPALRAARRPASRSRARRATRRSGRPRRHPWPRPSPCPDALRALVASLLAKSPEGRPPSAAAAREALQRDRGAARSDRPRPRRGRPSGCSRRPASSPAVVVPAELRERASRVGSRPARAGLSARQLTLLAALGVAVVVAVAWLPRWAQAPADALRRRSRRRPAPADPPAGPEATATSSAGGPAGAPEADPASTREAGRPRTAVASAASDPAPEPEVGAGPRPHARPPGGGRGPRAPPRRGAGISRRRRSGPPLSPSTRRPSR